VKLLFYKWSIEIVSSFFAPKTPHSLVGKALSVHVELIRQIGVEEKLVKHSPALLTNRSINVVIR